METVESKKEIILQSSRTENRGAGALDEQTDPERQPIPQPFSVKGEEEEAEEQMDQDEVDEEEQQRSAKEAEASQAEAIEPDD